MTKRGTEISSLALLLLLMIGCLDANAKTLVMKFQAKIERAILPSGMEITDKTIVGSILSGRLTLSTEKAIRDTSPTAGSGTTFFMQIVEELKFEGAIVAVFRGGNLFAQDGQVTISATKQYCVNCSAKGSKITTVGNANNKVGKTFQPLRYLLIQPAPHEGKNAEAEPTLRNIVKFDDAHPIRAMLFYSSSKSANDTLKLVVKISNLSLETP